MSDVNLEKYTTLHSNSYKSKAEKEQEEKESKPEVKKITSGKKQKKSIGTRFKETFIEEGSDSVGAYILWDVLIPAAKETISDLVTGSINMLLFGDSSSRGSRRGKGTKTAFRDYSSKISYKDERRESTSSRRSRKFAEDVLIEDSADEPARKIAIRIIADMDDLIQDYGRCTLADYYEMVGCDWDYTDKNWGWHNLSGVKPRTVRGGVIIDLPEVEQV